MIETAIVKDSISNEKHRLTTFKLKYPRFIHSEFMTHRAISRNASSSRAIPFARQVQQLMKDETRAAPVFWGAEQKGMQTATELDGYKLLQAKQFWRDAAHLAAKTAEEMAYNGSHKSIVNRIIEPFTHITVIASATENGWLNFFGLRLDSAAEPTMRALAIAMFEKYCESKPTLLLPGWWHLPFWDPEDSEAARDQMDDNPDFQIPVKVSVARCARVSYESFETGKRSTIDEDLKLYDRLVGAQPLHASPAEHQATPDFWENAAPETANPGWQAQSLWGNFFGWCQYRKLLSGEAIAPLPEEFKDRLPTF